MSDSVTRRGVARYELEQRIEQEFRQEVDL